MIYKCLNIRAGSKGWRVDFYTDREDREATKTSPQGLGFYWYPSTMKDQQAFTRLKKEMVKRHKQEIKRLHASLKELEALKLTT